MFTPIELEHARKRVKQRRYGRAFQAVRKAVSSTVATGTVVCHFCRKPILPGQAWALDHDVDGIKLRGPTHAKCNARDGGLRSHAPGAGPSRNWFQ